MTPALRIVDSGLRPARENLSVTEALSRRRRRGESPDTLRFQHFPRSAIIGRHQLLHREVNLNWVAANGVETARRMTGGGAIVMGPGLLGWELVLDRRLVPKTLDAVSEKICTGVAAGIARFGLPAAYRPRNDIEVSGRKVSGTGGYFDGNVVVFQGTVLIDLDLGLMTNALNLPADKLGKRGLAAFAERVGDLKGFLGFTPTVDRVEAMLAEEMAGALALGAYEGGLDEEEMREALAIRDSEIGTDGFVRGHDDHFPSAGRTVANVERTAGGTIEVILKLRDGAASIVDQALITGDFFVEPPRFVTDLEAHLRHRPADNLIALSRPHVERRDVHFLGIEPAQFLGAIAGAAQKACVERP